MPEAPADAAATAATSAARPSNASPRDDAADDTARLAALREASTLYRGPLLDGSGYDWANEADERMRRRAGNALGRTAGLLASGDCPLLLW